MQVWKAFLFISTVPCLSFLQRSDIHLILFPLQFMKIGLFSLLFLTLQTQVFAQVFAIVTVAALNPEREEQFVIQLDISNAPMNVANFMLLAAPSRDFFRNSGNATLTNNPSGSYRPSNEMGALLPGGVETYTISVNGSTALFNLPQGSVAIVNRTASINEVARFRLVGSTWEPIPDPFSPFTFRLQYNSDFLRWALEVDTSVTYLDEFDGSLTSGPFYDPPTLPRPIPVIGGDHPYISLGRRDSAANRPPGWVIQNEVIDPNFNNILSNSIFGNHFANIGGNVGAEQRYAVAFANDSRSLLNTAASELLITGTAGNPEFEGRHTCIGRVVEGTFRNPPTTIPGSRNLVDAIISGARPAQIRSIRFENIGLNFSAIDFGNRLPLVTASEGAARLDFSDRENPFLFANTGPGQIRFLDSSTDLQTWSRIGQTSRPSNGAPETGFPLRNALATSPRLFFSVSPVQVTYPDWPSEDFDFSGLRIRFVGREDDTPNTAPQVLNNFFINFDNNLDEGVLDGSTGLLSGIHELTNVSYQATGPFTGEIEMESETLAETLRFRLYFDAHKQSEVNSGTIIDRYHRLEDRVITILGQDIVIENQVQEFGLWSIQN